MKALQKVSKFLSDYTSIVVIAIAVITFFVPGMMAWVNNMLFVDFVANKFTNQSIIIGIIMFSMGLTLTAQDFKILAKRPFDICVGAIAQYLIMPFLALGITKALALPDAIGLGLILVGCCPGGVSSNIMSYLCGGDVAFSVGMTTVSTILSPFMTPFLVSLLASGTHISISALPMFVSIVETVILPVAIGFLLKYYQNKPAQAAKKEKAVSTATKTKETAPKAAKEAPAAKEEKKEKAVKETPVAKEEKEALKAETKSEERKETKATVKEEKREENKKADRRGN